MEQTKINRRFTTNVERQTEQDQLSNEQPTKEYRTILERQSISTDGRDTINDTISVVLRFRSYTYCTGIIVKEPESVINTIRDGLNNMFDNLITLRDTDEISLVRAKSEAFNVAKILGSYCDRLGIDVDYIGHDVELTYPESELAECVKDIIDYLL